MVKKEGTILPIKKKKVIVIEDDDESFEKPTPKKQNANIPWIEKYRPKTINDLVVDQCSLNKIKRIISDKNMPNIIITGIPGVGKTTTILCIAKYLLGKYRGQGVLELNASDDRGIKAVQDSIIYFCKKRFETEDEGNGREYAKHKIVVLDEADNMTKKAQQLVKNLMEEHNTTTRFAFTCNNSSDIIEAIQSRCIIFRYKRLTNSQVVLRLREICKIENVSYTDKGLNAIVDTAQGDMRRAINNLQLIYNGYTDITFDNVYKLCDSPHPLVISGIFKHCRDKNIKEALTCLNTLVNKGYSGSDISLSMIRVLKSYNLDDIDEELKMEFMIEISKTALVISKGVNSPIQLTGCVAKMCV